jgi:hypothetical protein
MYYLNFIMYIIKIYIEYLERIWKLLIKYHKITG